MLELCGLLHTLEYKSCASWNVVCTRSTLLIHLPSGGMWRCISNDGNVCKLYCVSMSRRMCKIYRNIYVIYTGALGPWVPGTQGPRVPGPRVPGPLGPWALGPAVTLRRHLYTHRVYITDTNITWKRTCSRLFETIP